MRDQNLHDLDDHQKNLHKDLCDLLASYSGKTGAYEALAIMSQISANLVLLLPHEERSTGIETILKNVDLVIARAVLEDAKPSGGVN